MLKMSLLAGIAASVLHVISGPDHLAAVTPLAIETRRKVWKIGVLWGLGHLTGMLLIGILFLLFKEYIPLEKISNYSEQLVGFTLLVIGVWALYSVFYKSKKQAHTHIHNGNEPFIHKYPHKNGRLDHGHPFSNHQKHKLWSSYAIGVLHGLAGIAHFILLLPVLGFESTIESAQYILGFAIGTVLAMTIYTYILGLIAGFSKGQANTFLFKFIRISGGVFAIVIGVYWIYLSY